MFKTKSLTGIPGLHDIDLSAQNVRNLRPARFRKRRIGTQQSARRNPA